MDAPTATRTGNAAAIDAQNNQCSLAKSRSRRTNIKSEVSGDDITYEHALFFSGCRVIRCRMRNTASAQTRSRRARCARRAIYRYTRLAIIRYRAIHAASSSRELAFTRRHASPALLARWRQTGCSPHEGALAVVVSTRRVRPNRLISHGAVHQLAAKSPFVTARSTDEQLAYRVSAAHFFVGKTLDAATGRGKIFLDRRAVDMKARALQQMIRAVAHLTSIKTPKVCVAMHGVLAILSSSSPTPTCSMYCARLPLAAITWRPADDAQQPQHAARPDSCAQESDAPPPLTMADTAGLARQIPLRHEPARPARRKARASASAVLFTPPPAGSVAAAATTMRSFSRGFRAWTTAMPPAASAAGRKRQVYASDLCHRPNGTRRRCRPPQADSRQQLRFRGLQRAAAFRRAVASGCRRRSRR